MTAKTCWTCGASILPGDAEARDEGRLASDAKKAVADMRERAARAVEQYDTLGYFDELRYKFVNIRDDVAAVIRALPLDSDTGGSDE